MTTCLPLQVEVLVTFMEEQQLVWVTLVAVQVLLPVHSLLSPA